MKSGHRFTCRPLACVQLYLDASNRSLSCTVLSAATAFASDQLVRSIDYKLTINLCSNDSNLSGNFRDSFFCINRRFSLFICSLISYFEFSFWFIL